MPQRPPPRTALRAARRDGRPRARTRPAPTSRRATARARCARQLTLLLAGRQRAAVCALLLTAVLNGCAGYRLVRLDEVDFPSYEPREVVIPTECTGLIQRAATEGLARLTEHEARTVAFCQQQQVLRALEEEAAARRLESHAAAARFALQLTTVVIGALIVIIGWAL